MKGIGDDKKGYCLPKSINSRLILDFRDFSDLFFADTMCQTIEKEVPKVLERTTK